MNPEEGIGVGVGVAIGVGVAVGEVAPAGGAGAGVLVCDAEPPAHAVRLIASGIESKRANIRPRSLFILVSLNWRDVVHDLMDGAR